MKIVLNGKVIGVSAEPDMFEGALGAGRMLLNWEGMPSPKPPDGFDLVDDEGGVAYRNCHITSYLRAFKQEDGALVILEDVDFVTGE